MLRWSKALESLIQSRIINYNFNIKLGVLLGISIFCAHHTNKRGEYVRIKEALHWDNEWLLENFAIISSLIYFAVKSL